MSANLCEQCVGACCRYVALPIDTPETAADFEDIRWYLLHEAVTIFVEDGSWHISFHTPCRYLLADFRCGLYEGRPKICRGYTTDKCDYHSGDYAWEHHFTCPEHLAAYLRDHPPAGDRRGTAPAKRRRASTAPPVDRHGVRLPPLPGR